MGQNISALLGFICFILIIVAATTAYIAYKNPDVKAVLFWSLIGLITIFLIGVLFFGGINLPQPRRTHIAQRLARRDMLLRTIAPAP